MKASARTWLALSLAAVSIGWLDPYATARQANKLLADGKYDDAVAKYNEALVDQPDSALLHYNVGVAAYKQGKYTDAINAFQQVPAPDDAPARTARVAYNIGNAKYKIGEAAESSDPKAALTAYAEALAAYRRAMGAAPDDTDIKFNHEFVDKKLADLKKKLEEQQKQQQDQPQQQNQQNEQKDKDEKDQQGQNQQKDENKEEQQKEQQQAEQKQEQGEQQQDQQQAAGGEPQEKKDGEMSRQEAAALLDSQRDQEVQPSDVIKKLQGAAVAEPAQDW